MSELSAGIDVARRAPDKWGVEGTQGMEPRARVQISLEVTSD